MAECTSSWNMFNPKRGLKKPDRTSAKVRIPMPDAYVYGLTGDFDEERDSDAERVVIITPVVTRITDMI